MYYLFKICILIACMGSVLPRHVSQYKDLDDEEEKLFRAAYDTPSYDHESYEGDYDLEPGKMDLLKDGLWAVKAKLKELKAFDKALAANLLSTKLKLKELLQHHLLSPLLDHHHKKKPNYHYQTQPYPVYEPPNGGGQYGPQYGHDPYYGH